MSSIKENKSKTVKSKKSPIAFLKGVYGEIKRITWATGEETKKATISVIVICAIFVIAMAILDFGFSNLYQAVFR